MGANHFQPGYDPRRNAQQTFKAGHQYRWQPGQSGNPAGFPKSRQEFERAFYEALIGEGSPEEAAQLLWGCARAKEPWAVQLLLQRLAPQDTKLRLEVTHGADDFDPSRLSDSELADLTRLLERAAGEPAAIESGTGAPIAE